MPSLRSLLLAALLGLCLTTSGLHAAEAPSRENVQRSLDGLADRKLPEADQKAVQQTLEQTLALIDQAAPEARQRRFAGGPTGDDRHDEQDRG